MEINAYVCPQCGAPLQVAENATFTTCPKCGCNLKISYSNSENVVPPENRDVRKFVTSEGVYLGTAVVPQNYEVDAVYEALWRSEMVPIYYGFKATRNDHSVFMAAYSKELFHDIRNAFLKGMIKLVDAHARSGYEKFIEPDAYLIKEANKIAGVPLTLTGKAKLPSIIGNNPDLARKLLYEDINSYALFTEMKPEVVSEYTDSVLYRFSGKLNNQDVMVLCGMDYEGAELAYTKPVFSGLLSKMKDSAKGANQPFGHSNKHVDHIMFGPQWLYFCMFYAEAEQEAVETFMRFINSIVPDQNLNERAQKMFDSKFAAISQQIAYNQARVQQNLVNLQMNQQRLAQTLQDNANAMSNMIMDSWNQKMASDSRISQARSEATMGVNTYTNSYGQNVQVSVVADHVYQDQHGDVHGVSGNELDQDVLNSINWTKIDK